MLMDLCHVVITIRAGAQRDILRTLSYKLYVFIRSQSQVIIFSRFSIPGVCCVRLNIICQPRLRF